MLTKTEVKYIAKNIVADKGPYLVLEFCSEFVEQDAPLMGWTEQDQEAIITEAMFQADRVLVFLGLA